MSKRFDVFGMCNALFDLQAEVDDELLGVVGLAKGGMTLLSDEEQQAIVPQVYRHIVNTESGGSGANTMIGVTQLGGTAAFTSRVGADEHGQAYRDGLAKQGVQPNLGKSDSGETGVCLVLITPDAQRTMGTYLGLARQLQASDVIEDDIRASRYIYVTGYLWDTDNQKDAVLHAMETAKRAGDVKVSFSLSDPFCVHRHKNEFLALLTNYVDVVFANREEAIAITDKPTVEEAALALAEMTGGLAAVTSDKDGSLLVRGTEIVRIPVYSVTALDTTGAGDMYAAGILYGLTQDLPLSVTGRIASYAAGQVVARIGPRLPAIDSEAVEVIKRETFTAA
jgi:sugar/nucleoside kinase (ribokinase family)